MGAAGFWGVWGLFYVCCFLWLHTNILISSSDFCSCTHNTAIWAITTNYTMTRPMPTLQCVLLCIIQTATLKLFHAIFWQTCTKVNLSYFACILYPSTEYQSALSFHLPSWLQHRCPPVTFPMQQHFYHISESGCVLPDLVPNFDNIISSLQWHSCKGCRKQIFNLKKHVNLSL